MIKTKLSAKSDIELKKHNNTILKQFTICQLTNSVTIIIIKLNIFNNNIIVYTSYILTMIK